MTKLLITNMLHILASGQLRNLGSWYAAASRADWQAPADIKTAYRHAGFLANNQVVFNIKGNAYRLVVAAYYNRNRMFIRFVGSHEEYDRIDATTV